MLTLIKPNIRSLNLINNIFKIGKISNNVSVIRSQACNLHLNGSLLRPLLFEKELLSNNSDACLIAKRWYAKKGKESKDKKGKSKQVKLDINNPEVSEIIDFEKLDSQMEFVLKQLEKELSEQLTLRITLETVGKVIVETDKGVYKLSDIAQIQQKSPQMIIVHTNGCPQDASRALTAITKSGMNVTPQIEGTSLYLPIQKVTREHREKLVKSAKAIYEKYKEKLRNVQNNHVKEVKSHKSTHSEDLLKEVSEYVINKGKVMNSKAEEMLATRQKELMNL